MLRDATGAAPPVWTVAAKRRLAHPRLAAISSAVPRFGKGMMPSTDAGLEPASVDGIMPFPNLGTAEEIAANLGCANLRFAATVHTGGAAPVASLNITAAAVTNGMADYVLLPAGWNGYSSARVRRTVATDTASIPGGAIARDYYLPHGFVAPPQWYSVIARRHMYEFGTRPEQLG